MMIWLLILCLLISPPLGFAGPRLLIPPTANKSTTEEQAAMTELKQHFSKDGRLKLVEPEAVETYLNNKRGTPALKEQPSPETLKADKNLKAGWAAYKKLAIKSAIEQLEAAKIAYRGLTSELKENYKKMLTAYLHLGIAYIANGETTRGEQEIRDMIILDPARANRKLSPKFYNPEVITTYNRLRKAVIAQPVGSLLIEITPAAAKLWVDGEIVQGTLANKLPEGDHFVMAEAAGHKSFFSNKFIVPGQNQMSVKLETVIPQDLSASFAPVSSAYDMPQETVQLLNEMSAKLGIDIYLLYNFQRDADSGALLSLTATLFDQRSQELSSQESATLGGAKPTASIKPLAASLLKQIDARGYVVSRGRALETSPNPDENLTQFDPTADPKADAVKPKPWYKKGWIVGSLIAGTALIVGGVLLLDSSSSTSTLQIDNPSN